MRRTRRRWLWTSTRRRIIFDWFGSLVTNDDQSMLENELTREQSTRTSFFDLG